MASATAVTTLKKALRKELKARLRSVSPSSSASQSEAVVKRLFELDVFKTSRRISVYISMPTGEINTRTIIQHILQSNDKTCYVPRWTPDAMEMVKINTWEEYISLPVNKWNIPEPSHDVLMENALDSDGLDLILVPGMAFDEQRNRIGHGKGYYDRYLQTCNAWAAERGREGPKTVGLALEEQIVPVGTIPLEPTDQKLDCVLTSSKKYK